MPIIQMKNYISIWRPFDPQSALDLHPNNRQRVLRAIEIYEESGKEKVIF